MNVKQNEFLSTISKVMAHAFDSRKLSIGNTSDTLFKAYLICMWLINRWIWRNGRKNCSIKVPQAKVLIKILNLENI